jgi:dipeptidyl aminopeptidase/acylaminoacyl peptidase
VDRLIRWLVTAILALHCATVAARPYNIDDLLGHEDIGRILADPAGHWLLFEKYEAHLAMPRQDRLSLGQLLRSRPFIVDLRGGGPARPLLEGDRPGTILLGLSPSGKRVAVARLEEGRFRFGIVTLSTGAAIWWPYAPLYDGFHNAQGWLSDDRLVILTQRDDTPAGRLALDWPAEKLMRERWDRTAAGALAVSISGSGRYLSGDGRSQQQLVSVDALSGEVKILASGPFEQMQLSPDGRHVALIEADRALQPGASDAVREDQSSFSRNLRLLDLVSGLQSQPCSRCSLPGDTRWSDDSSNIAFVADRGSDRQAMMVDVDRHIVADIAAARTDRASERCTLSEYQDVPAPARASVAQVDEGTGYWVPMSCRGATAQAVARWEKADWERRPHDIVVRRRSGQTIVLPWTAEGAISSVMSMPVGSPGDSLLRISAVSGRNTLLLAGRGGVRPLMTLNNSMQDVEPAIMRRLLHRSADGLPVTSWLVLPPGQAHPHKLAMVIIPYPGQIYSNVPPADQQVEHERFYTNAQLLAASGFAVLLPSVPMPAVLPDGGFDFAAVLAPAIEAAISTGVCDPERMALWGHSYGGYSVAMAAAQNSYFRAVVASSGIYDLAATAGTFGRAMRLSPEEGLNLAASYAWAENGQGRMGVAPWVAPMRYIANSPIYLADRVQVPMLIVGADRDFSPIEQGEQLFSALFRQGKDAQLVTYWGEGHVIGSPANLRDFYARVIGFLREHLVPRGQPVPLAARAAPSIPASSVQR